LLAGPQHLAAGGDELDGAQIIEPAIDWAASADCPSPRRAEANRNCGELFGEKPEKSWSSAKRDQGDRRANQ